MPTWRIGSAMRKPLSDFEKFDYIFVMDGSNYDNVIELAKTDEERKKVVVPMRIELMTSALLARRSNQLS